MLVVVRGCVNRPLRGAPGRGRRRRLLRRLLSGCAVGGQRPAVPLPVEPPQHQPAAAKTYGPWSDHHTSKFRLLGVLYADAEIKMDALFVLSPPVGPGVEITDEVEADNIETDRANAYATLEVPDPGKAVAHCRVTRRFR